MYTSIIYHIYIHIACIYNIHVIISKMAWGSPVFPSRCSLLPLLQVLTVRKRLGRTRTWDLTRAGQAQHKLTSFFLEFSKTHVVLPKMKCTSKIVSGFVSGILMSDFSRNSSCQKSIMLEISTRREGFPTGASSLLEISFLWTIKRNYTPECIQPESFWHTSFDVLSSVEGSC